MCVILGACDSNTPHPEPPPKEPGLQTIVIWDRSGSVSVEERSRQLALTSEILGQLSYGDELMVQVAHAAGVADASASLRKEMPDARNRGRPTHKERQQLELAMMEAEDELRQFVDGGRAGATDLLATLHTAQDFLRARGDRRSRLVLMSDMLHCTRNLCMENGRVPGAEWVEQQRAGGRIPDLVEACVSVVGADASTEAGISVRNFWTAYFKAANAVFDPANWRYQVPTAEALGC